MPAFGASIDVIASASISPSVGVFATQPGFGVDRRIAQRLAGHGLATAIAARAMCLVLVPTVLEFILGEMNCAGAFTHRALSVAFRNRIPA